MADLGQIVFSYDGGVGLSAWPAPDIYTATQTALLKPVYGAGLDVEVVRIGPESYLRPNGLTTPQVTFTTRLDGILEARPVWLMFNGIPVKRLPALQPSVLTNLPAGVDVEFVVIGDGVKRTEVWGPYQLPPNQKFRLTGTYPDGVVGVAYSASIIASGFVEPAVWDLNSGEIPDGLEFDSGVLSGTPTLAGTFRFSFTVTVGDGAVKYRDCVIVIAT